MRVAILGCGPAGLLAAHAALTITDRVPDILSVKRKSRTGGAMYLHEAIPGLTSDLPEAHIKFLMEGDAATYAAKVYGDGTPASMASFNRYRHGPNAPAWNLTRAYDDLWDMFDMAIQDMEVGPAVLPQVLESYDLVLSTIPQKVLCVEPQRHAFPEQEVWIAPNLVVPIPPNTIQYNGTDRGSWYRQSSLFGWKGTEWSTISVERPPPLPGVVKVSKPVQTNCDCWMGTALKRVGRYGTWDKRILTHDAYHQAFGHIKARAGETHVVQ